MSVFSGNTPAVGLYTGTTWHGRREPIRRGFRYRVWSVLVDLDHLAPTTDRSRLLSYGRGGWCSLRDDDHVLPLDAEVVRGWLSARGVATPIRSIRLLTSPRVFGRVFNPISLWWCSDDREQVVAVIAEVHNTSGGRHAYLVRPREDGQTATDKVLEVSPFLPDEGRYRLRLRTSADQFDVHIGYEHDGHRVFDATWRGTHAPLTDRNLATALLRDPLWSLRVRALIQWQGVRLWARRLPPLDQPRPEHDDATDTSDLSGTSTTVGARG